MEQNTLSYNILLLGSGGREHAIAWKLKQSPRCAALWIAPGNGGTATLGTNVSLDLKDFGSIADFCVEHEINMLIVGPEAPLVDGIVDHMQGEPRLQHLLCVGPSRAGAMLEGSKDFAKEFMSRHDIPTARHRTFTQANAEEGREYLKSHEVPIVLKADGLAAGKGVLICMSRADALEEFDTMLGGKFGDAGATVVVEQFLSGIEFSVFVLTDGCKYCILPIAKDYKRIGEGDTGLNTGGMGSVSPVPFVDAVLMEKVRSRIIEPTVQGIAAEQIDYRGFIFIGLISVGGEPYVIEYNCRLGDPETEVVLPRLRSDLLDLFDAMEGGTLDQFLVEMDVRFAATVVCASGGYPGAYDTGVPIELPESDRSLVFHAGTKVTESGLMTSGGRVLAVTSMAGTLKDALRKSNKTASEVQFSGKYYRTDIGFDL
jgi:phosphoribosylamine--glycine ligase